MKRIFYTSILFYLFVASTSFSSVSINPKDIKPGTIDETEFGYLNGVTSNIQTQLTILEAEAGSNTVWGSILGSVEDQADLWYELTNRYTRAQVDALLANPTNTTTVEFTQDGVTFEVEGTGLYKWTSKLANTDGTGSGGHFSSGRKGLIGWPYVDTYFAQGDGTTGFYSKYTGSDNSREVWIADGDNGAGHFRGTYDGDVRDVSFGTATHAIQVEEGSTALKDTDIDGTVTATGNADFLADVTVTSNLTVVGQSLLADVVTSSTIFMTGGGGKSITGAGRISDIDPDGMEVDLRPEDARDMFVMERQSGADNFPLPLGDVQLILGTNYIAFALADFDPVFKFDLSTGDAEIEGDVTIGASGDLVAQLGNTNYLYKPTVISGVLEVGTGRPILHLYKNDSSDYPELVIGDGTAPNSVVTEMQFRGVNYTNRFRNIPSGMLVELSESDDQLWIDIGGAYQYRFSNTTATFNANLDLSGTLTATDETTVHQLGLLMIDEDGNVTFGDELIAVTNIGSAAQGNLQQGHPGDFDWEIPGRSYGNVQRGAYGDRYIGDTTSACMQIGSFPTHSGSMIMQSGNSGSLQMGNAGGSGASMYMGSGSSGCMQFGKLETGALMLITNGVDGAIQLGYIGAGVSVTNSHNGAVTIGAVNSVAEHSLSIAGGFEVGTYVYSDLTPVTSNTYNLGSALLKWSNIHCKTGHFDSATIYLGDTALKATNGTLVVQDGTNTPIPSLAFGDSNTNLVNDAGYLTIDGVTDLGTGTNFNWSPASGYFIAKCTATNDFNFSLSSPVVGSTYLVRVAVHSNTNVNWGANIIPMADTFFVAGKTNIASFAVIASDEILVTTKATP